MTQAVENQPGGNAPASPATPAPGTPEYAAAMAKAYESQVPPPATPDLATPPATSAPAPATKPAGIPDEFWDAATGAVRVEDLAKAYAALKAPAAETPPATETPPASEAPKPGQAAEAYFASPEGAAELQAGKPSEATLKMLADLGFSAETVNLVFKGYQAQAEAGVKALHEAAGGKEAFESLYLWGKQNVNAAEFAFIESAINSGNSKTAIDLLKLRQSQAGAVEPVLHQGNAAASAASAGFASQAEMVSAMRDPRYQSDPAYRRSVMDRLRVSSF